MSYAAPKRVVTAPNAKSAAIGPPNKVLHVMPAHYFAVQYTDGEGNVKRAILLEVDGQFYAAPGAEDYAEKLVPVTAWLQKLLKADPKVNPVNSADLEAALKNEPALRVI